MTSATDVPAAIRRYAASARPTLPDGCSVRSYAGLWLLLASLAPATSGPLRREVTAALGAEPEDAAGLARRLLHSRHPAVGLAAAGWLRKGYALSSPLPVDLDPLPEQEALDAWARQATRGLIETFPVDSTGSVLLLASAVVAEVSWSDELTITDDDRLEVRDGLLAVVDTAAAGRVAVVIPATADDVDVISVIAAPDVTEAAVWAAVDEIIAWQLADTLTEHRVPAADLTDGHAWRVVETVEELSDEQPDEIWEAVVPAWTLQSRTDLTGAPGVRAIAGTIAPLIEPAGPYSAKCIQDATATYKHTGFSAAAITVLDFGPTGAPLWETRTVHRVALLFDRPHAVVAVARGEDWEGIPVIHAWVDGRTQPAVFDLWGR